MNQKTYGSNFALKINSKTHSHQTQNNEKYFLSRQKIQNTAGFSQLFMDSYGLLPWFSKIAQRAEGCVE
jgi:hypothetical protein